VYGEAELLTGCRKANEPALPPRMPCALGCAPQSYDGMKQCLQLLDSGSNPLTSTKESPRSLGAQAEAMAS
jgi:hypothetical protein